MKKIMITTLCLTFGLLAYAQKHVPVKGNWVVESNVKDPKNSMVFFYNDNLELIYQEKITGKKINIDRAKVKKALNQTLQIALSKKNYKNDSLLLLSLLRR